MKEFDPFENYRGGVLVGESGMRYFIGWLANQFLTEKGEAMAFPDEIEFSFGDCEYCHAYRDGSCQTNAMELVSVIRPDQNGVKHRGTACRSKAYGNIFCRFYPVENVLQ